jgi:hypothetical protein
LEKAGQGISPEGKTRGKNETPTGQDLDTVGDKDARSRQGRELKVQGGQLLPEQTKQKPSQQNCHGENYRQKIIRG